MTGITNVATFHFSVNKVLITWLNSSELIARIAIQKDSRFAESWVYIQYQEFSWYIAYCIFRKLPIPESLKQDFARVSKAIAKFGDKTNAVTDWDEFSKEHLFTEFTWAEAMTRNGW